jgi:hypothetical protein
MKFVELERFARPERFQDRKLEESLANLAEVHLENPDIGTEVHLIGSEFCISTAFDFFDKKAIIWFQSNSIDFLSEKGNTADNRVNYVRNSHLKVPSSGTKASCIGYKFGRLKHPSINFTRPVIDPVDVDCN